jgi:hypothetical protein
MHEKLGIDILNYKTTWTNEVNFDTSRDEDYAGNILHFFLFIVAVLSLMVFYKYFKTTPLEFSIIACAMGMFVFFSLLLKWQPWHGRLHVPIFMVFSIAIAIFLGKINRSLMYGVAFVISLGSLSYLLENSTKILIFLNPKITNRTRDETMFAKKGQESLNELYELKKYCDENKIEKAGLWLHEDSWDYPFFVILKRDNPVLKLYHVNVSRYKNGNEQLYDVVPEIIMSTQSNHADSISANSVPYKNVKKLSTIDLYLRQP